MDVTNYLSTYAVSPRKLAKSIMQDVLKNTGITATAGIGTNMYLAKVAMDIVAKHIPPDKERVRIASLNEMSYRKILWDHQPLTDFWRVGKGYAKKLEQNGLYTMGDIARCSMGKPNEYHNEELDVYKRQTLLWWMAELSRVINAQCAIAASTAAPDRPSHCWENAL